MVREDWIKNDETFTNPVKDECEEDFEDRFQEVTKKMFLRLRMIRLLILMIGMVILVVLVRVE